MNVIDFGPWLINVEHIESIRKPMKLDADKWDIQIRVIPDNGTYYSQLYSSEFEANQVFKKITDGFSKLNK